MNSLQHIGLSGSIMLSLCGIPELYKSYKNKRCDMGWGMLSMWTAGELLMIIYVIPKADWILTVNYGINLLNCLGLVYYKLKYRLL